MRKDVSFLARWLIFPLLGGAAGYLYYRLVGCADGSCPLTSSPIVSVLFGVFCGLLLAAG